MADAHGDQLATQPAAQIGPRSQTSAEGILADALANRLLSIPGGRQDVARIPDNAEEVEALALSHTVGAQAASADAGGGASAFGDVLCDDADALVTAEGVPIISQTFSLGRQGVARASYDDPVKRSIRVTNVLIQLLVQPTYSATNSVNIAHGRFSGTLGWTSTDAVPKPDDVVTLRVESFTPFTASTSPNGNDYSYEAVMQRFQQYAGVQPTYITAQSTGAECGVNRLYGVSAASPVTLKFVGQDILTRESLQESFIVSTNGVSIQYPPYLVITYNKNTADSLASAKVHKGSAYVNAQTYTQAPAYDRPGYRLLGWSRDPAATTAMWAPLTSFVSPFTSNTTLYAVWSKNALSTVSLRKNDGTADDAYKTLTLWHGRGWYETGTPSDATSRMTSLTLPTWPGHEFKGFSTSKTDSMGTYWTTETDFPAADDTTLGSQATAKSTTLYATWKLLTYDIAYDPDGGTMPETVVGNKETYTVNSLTYTLPRPTKPGHVFKGWTVTGNDPAGYDYSTGPVTILTSLSNGQKGTWGNLSCKANWEPAQYDVRFSANGGTGGPASSLKATYGSAMPTPVATREGYSFLGWWDKADYTAEGAKQYYSAAGASLCSYEVEGALTLYAAWGKQVDFIARANGGALMYSPMCRWEGEGLWFIGNVVRYIVNDDLSLTTIDANGTNRTIRTDEERTDKRLVGWGASPLGPLLPKGEVPTAADLDLYAIWEGSGTLHAFANGGAVKYSETCVWSGDGQWIIPLVTRCVAGEDGSLATTAQDGAVRKIVSNDSNRTLLGWSLSADGPILAPGTYVLTQETSLYAIWSEGGEVGRYPNGGALMYAPTCRWSGENYVNGVRNDWRLIGAEKFVIRDDAKVAVHTPNDPSEKLRTTGADPDATDRQLLGWSRTATGPLLEAGTYGAVGYVGLYAVWDSSTISFDANSGEGGQSSPVKATYGEAMPAISTEKPVRTGYAFTGWYDTPNADDPAARRFYTEEGAGVGPWDVGCDVTLYAGWSPNSYQVILDANGEGAIIDGEEALDAMVGKELALPSATRTGYAFQGWALDPAGRQRVPDPAIDLATGEKGDDEVTLYACWTLITEVELPVTAASGVSFELAVPDGTLRVAGSEDATEAQGWLRSKMPVEVALDSVSCQAAEGAEGASEAEAFWAQHGSFADLVIRPDDLVATGSLTLSAGERAEGTAIPASFAIPAATSEESLGERRLLYSLSLDRLFADPSTGGGGVDILDLLPDGSNASFALPARLFDVVVTVDVTKYA